MKTYTFHVSLPGHGRMWRKLELRADQTLEDLHWTIQRAFEFAADHLYSFFMSGKAWDRSSEYSLPEGADPWGLDDIDSVMMRDEDGNWVEVPLEDLEDDDEFDDEDWDDVVGLDPAAEADMMNAIESGTFRSGLLEMLGLPPDFQVPPDYSLDMNMFEMLEFMQQSQDKPPQTFTDDEKTAFVYISEMALEFANSAGPDFFDPEAGDVRTTTLDSLALNKGQTFLYLFDYGDEWRFKVRVHAINANAPDDADYPLIVETVGEAPEQYPEWDEDEWEDEDDA